MFERIKYGHKRAVCFFNVAFAALVILCQLLLLTGCNGGEANNYSPIIFKSASEMDDSTGWYFCVTYTANREKPDERNYAFVSVNLRYRYMESYWTRSYQEEMLSTGEKIYWEHKTKTSLVGYFGSNNEALKRDNKVLYQILDNKKSPEELLALNPDDFTFEEFDKDLLFRLIRAALENPENELGSQDHPNYGTAIGAENNYINGYRFQIAFSLSNQRIDEIYIDVCYQTGEAYNAYTQLSDLVEKGKASADQKKAFEEIQKIRRSIKENDSFIAGAEEYKGKTIGDIEFVRLFSYLNAIQAGDLSGYNGYAGADAPWISETITEEEFRQYTEWGKQ